MIDEVCVTAFIKKYFFLDMKSRIYYSTLNITVNIFKPSIQQKTIGLCCKPICNSNCQSR